MESKTRRENLASPSPRVRGSGRGPRAQLLEGFPVDWYVVKLWRGSKQPRPTHVLIGDEDITIWTPTMADGSAFPRERARKIAKLKANRNEKVTAIPKRLLAQYALEWILVEQAPRQFPLGRVTEL